MGGWKEAGSDFADQTAIAVPIPTKLKKVDFLFFGLGEVKYLAGIKWPGAEGNSVEVGYQTCDHDDLECELVYKQLGVRDSLRVPLKRIRGFVR